MKIAVKEGDLPIFDNALNIFFFFLLIAEITALPTGKIAAAQGLKTCSGENLFPDANIIKCN